MRRGVAGVMPPATRGERLLGRGHVRGVERAGDLQRDDAGLRRRRRGELLQRRRATRRRRSGRRRCGWPGSSPAASIAATTSSGSPPSTALMPVGSSAQAAAISRPRTAAKVIAVSGGEHAGQRGRADLADAVAGDHADVVERQVLGGEQRGRDQQRLGLGGVADLVGVGARCRGGPGRRRPARTTSAAAPRSPAGRARGRGSRVSASPGPGRELRARPRLSRIPAGHFAVLVDQTLRQKL